MLVTVNSVSESMVTCNLLRYQILKFIQIYTRSRRIAESYDSSFLNFLRNLYTIFHSDYQLALSPGGVRWPLIVVSICIFLMISFVKFLLYLSLATCISFVWKNVCSSPLSILKLDYLGVLYLFVLLVGVLYEFLI